MANEARVNSNLNIIVRNDDGQTLLEYQSRPAAFQADVATAKGPTPGAMEVTRDGTDINLSELDQPGLTHVMNMDDTNTIVIGRWDPDTDRFYPVFSLLPGETYVFRLAEDVEDEYAGTGTGTTATASTVRAKVLGGESAVLFFGAFES